VSDALELKPTETVNTAGEGVAGEADQPAAARTPRSGPFAALAQRPFRWWFSGQVLSASGLMTQMVATSWLVLQLTNSGVALAVLSGVGLGPVMLLGLWAGSVIDHRETRTVLLFTQTAFTVLSLLLFALIEAGGIQYWEILVISGLSGTINAMDMPARQVYVQELVGPDLLAGAVSLYEVILNLSRIFGPAVGGVLLAVSGPGLCVLANALSFLAPLYVLLRFRPARAVREHPHAERPKALEGLRYAWSQPPLRACLILAAASSVIFNFSVLLPLLAHRSFHLGGGGYGSLIAAFGIGALPGALLASRSQPTGHRVRVLGTLTGVSLALIGLAPDLPIAYAAMVVTGTTSIWMIAAANTLVQLRSGPEIRGRVMGAWSMALPGMVPVTSLLAGGLADLTNARVAYTASGVVLAGIGLGFWRSFGRE
jgi:MFS family permease